MAVKLSKTVVDKEIAKGAGGGERFVFDATLPGFALRLRGQTATYVFCYRYHGRSQRVKVAEASTEPKAFAAAREIAQDLYNTVRAGGDPAAMKREERARRLTVAGMMEAYLVDFASRVETVKASGRKSTLAEFRSTAERSINRHIGNVEVEALTLERVAAWHNLFAATPTTGNRAASVAAAAFNYGQRRNLISPGPNPFEQVDKFLETKRKERLTVTQVEKLGVALRECIADGTVDGRGELALRLFLYTGMRRSEIVGHQRTERRSEGNGLRWRDVDLDAGVVYLHRAKAGARVVILPSVAVAALRAAKPSDAAPDDCVIPGRTSSTPYVTIEFQLRKIFNRAGVPWPGGVHAYRRTLASVAGELGFGEYVIGGLLGHGASSVTDGYVKVSTDPLRLAAERVAGEIAAALDGKKEAKVLEFHFAENR